MSEEQLRDQAHDRWRETLALLGLPPEPENKDEPTLRSPEPAIEVQAAKPEPPRHFERKPEPPAFVERQAEMTPPAAPIYTEPAFEEVVVKREPGHQEAQVEGAGPPEARDFEEEPQSRGRRRGRRGGRSRSYHAADETSATAPGAAAAEGETDAAVRGEPRPQPREDRSRGRGQGRRMEVPEPEPREIAEEEEDQEVEAMVEESTEDGHDEEPDTLSDWNVPSWQDLISSLYRPDR